ncbi:Flavoredoxin [Pontiella desulfatans]|uniref:Flavoredoxin n=1 Tax=Pontiella desulfatans TaxID=2750659 RepID=A0A6C2TZC7_PONDE|nr:flavin reductase family protein [Pontiella desulfatans]VGO12955.1 Flavoredoxin [Pontiella desulfatans]
MKTLKEINPLEIPGNPIHLIGKEWMLLSAGTPEHFNTMTASWGGMGELWFKPVCFCFVRPQRYTYEFMEQGDVFTLSFFDEKYKPQLNFCGSRTGRETDKAGECGFTPLAADNGSVYFEQARMVLECRKLYFQDMEPANFLDDSIMKNYPKEDFHRMYIGEITRVLIED